jgi:GT2 family glycosyltransferase
MDDTWPDRLGRSRGTATVASTDTETARSGIRTPRTVTRDAADPVAAERTHGATPAIGDASGDDAPPIRFSVYIPVWNEAGWLPGAIESVLAQTYPEWELIIGDNVSTDDLASIVGRYDDPRIRYVRWDRHVPMSENHNRTMLLGRYEWLHVLSADDRMAPTCLETIADRIRTTRGRTERLAMVAGACRRVDEHGEPTDLMDARVGRSELYEQIPDGLHDAEAWVRLNAAPGVRPWMVGAVSVERALVNEIGGWRPDMGLCHDLEFLLRIAAYGDVAYIDQPLLDYTVRRDSLTTSLSQRHMDRNEAMVQQGAAWLSILHAHGQRRTISSAERSEVHAAIARAFLQRAIWQRVMAGGLGRPGAIRDVARAFRHSPRTVLAPSRFVAAILAIAGPVGLIHRIRTRAHRAGRVII